MGVDKNIWCGRPRQPNHPQRACPPKRVKKRVQRLMRLLVQERLKRLMQVQRYWTRHLNRSPRHQRKRVLQSPRYPRL